MALAALSASGVVATGAVATAGSVSKQVRRQQAPPPRLYGGYTDTYRPGAPSHPTPWQGHTGVQFEGCNYYSPDRCPKTNKGKDRYDAGALRVVNTTGQSITISNVIVTIGSCVFNPWHKLNVTLPIKGQLILTQTGGSYPCGAGKSKYNFDTSETSQSCKVDDGEEALVSLTEDGDENWFYLDTSQVLNLGGLNPGKKKCGAHNERRDWVRIPLETE